MKSRELLERDWVFDGCNNVQVTIDNIYETYKSDWDVYPIPLTEEILKVNGFVKSKDGRYYYAPKDNRFILGFMGGFANLPAHIFVECGFYPVVMKYVHELQHALRLCGLNDLADNFKVL